MWRRALAFLAVAAVTAVLFTPICDVLHRCGCTLSSGATYCNARGATGPHCPWCEHPVLGGISAALIVGGQLLVFGLVLRRASILGAGRLRPSSRCRSSASPPVRSRGSPPTTRTSWCTTLAPDWAFRPGRSIALAGRRTRTINSAR